MPRKERSKAISWERDRRNRMNSYFKSLADLLPPQQEGRQWNKMDILMQASVYIKSLQSRTEELFSANATQAQKDELDRLKKLVMQLFTRTQLLSSLLKQAGISVPSEPALEKISPLKWSNKLNLDDVEKYIATKDETKKKKTKATAAKVPSAKKCKSSGNSASKKSEKAVESGKGSVENQENCRSTANEEKEIAGGNSSAETESKPANCTKTPDSTPKTSTPAKPTTKEKRKESIRRVKKKVAKEKKKPKETIAPPTIKHSIANLTPGTLIFSSAKLMPVVTPITPLTSNIIVNAQAQAASPIILNNGQHNQMIVMQPLANTIQSAASKGVLSANIGINANGSKSILLDTHDWVSNVKNVIVNATKIGGRKTILPKGKDVTRTTMTYKVPISAIHRERPDKSKDKSKEESKEKGKGSSKAQKANGADKRGESSKKREKSATKRGSTTSDKSNEPAKKKKKVAAEQSEVKSKSNFTATCKSIENLKSVVDKIGDESGGSGGKETARPTEIDAPKASTSAEITGKLGDVSNSLGSTSAIAVKDISPQKEANNPSQLVNTSVQENLASENGLSKGKDKCDSMVVKGTEEQKLLCNPENTFAPIGKSEALHSDLSNDLFASLQVPSNSNNPESISPTAAFLMAFPLVSSSNGKTEVLEDEMKEDFKYHSQTPTVLLQIGAMEPNSFKIKNNEQSSLPVITEKSMKTAADNNFELPAQTEPIRVEPPAKTMPKIINSEQIKEPYKILQLPSTSSAGSQTETTNSFAHNAVSSCSVQVSTTGYRNYNVRSNITTPQAMPDVRSNIAATQTLPDLRSNIMTSQPLPETRNHIATSQPLPVTRNHIATSQTLPETRNHIVTSQPLPETRNHIATSQTLPETRNHIATSQPLPVTRNHIATSQTLPDIRNNITTSLPIARNNISTLQPPPMNIRQNLTSTQTMPNVRHNISTTQTLPNVRNNISSSQALPNVRNNVAASISQPLPDFSADISAMEQQQQSSTTKNLHGMIGDKQLKPNYSMSGYDHQVNFDLPDTSNIQQQQQQQPQAQTQQQQQQQQRPLVNWMMTPETKSHNSNITDILPPICKEIDYCQSISSNNNLFSQTPTYNQTSSNQFYNNYDMTAHSFPNLLPTDTKRITDVFYSEDQPFSWSPTKSNSHCIEQSQIPTLPALTGDLALGTNITNIPDKQNFLFGQMPPMKTTNDLTVKEPVKDKSMGLAGKDFHGMLNNNPQTGHQSTQVTSFLSVSQLVEHEKAEKNNHQQQHHAPIHSHHQNNHPQQQLHHANNPQQQHNNHAHHAHHTSNNNSNNNNNHHTHPQQQQTRKHQRKTNTTSPRTAGKRQVDMRKQSDQMHRHEEQKLNNDFSEQTYNNQQQKYQHSVNSNSNNNWRNNNTRNCKSNYTAEALISGMSNNNVTNNVNNSQQNKQAPIKFTSNYAQNTFAPSALPANDPVMPQINYFSNTEDPTGYGQVVNQNFNHTYPYSSNTNIYPTTNFITSISNTSTNYMMPLHDNTDYWESNTFLLPNVTCSTTSSTVVTAPTTTSVTTGIAKDSNHYSIKQNYEKRPSYSTSAKKGNSFYSKPAYGLPPPLPTTVPTSQTSTGFSGNSNASRSGISSNNHMAMNHHQSGTSLTNFNVSSIFPEINDKVTGSHYKAPNSLSAGTIQASNNTSLGYPQRSTNYSTNSICNLPQVSEALPQFLYSNSVSSSGTYFRDNSL